jgi:hypothetical protein
MNTGNTRAPDRKPGDNLTDVDDSDKTTPSTDMQPEDAGTADSGNTGRGTAAEGAMKQTSKTGQERGSGGQ